MTLVIALEASAESRITWMLGVISRAPVISQLQYALSTFSLRAPGGLTGDGARTLSPIARPI